MERAGFVLAGGQSSRMGRDKALLTVDGATLLERTAAAVRAAAGSATVVAPSGRYEDLGLPMLADREPGLGPLGGIATALESTSARWNLIVACDMPGLTAEFLEQLLEKARAADAQAFLPIDASGQVEPLCAVYRADCAGVMLAALAAGVRKVTASLAGLRAEYWQVTQNQPFINLNSPQDWDSFRHA